MVVVLLLLMLLASYTTFHATRRWYVPVSLGWTVVFLSFGWAIGLTKAEMGLDDWIPGLIWGGACIAVVSTGMALGIAVPRMHPLFADERVQRFSGPQLAAKSLIEIPLGTVLLEEIVFRSLLLGLLTSNWGTVVGVLGSSLLFGFWHVLPALEMHDSHALTRGRPGILPKITTVGATVLGTGAAGVGFAMLVVLSGSVLAPMGLHWALNGSGSIAAWLVGRGIPRRFRPGGSDPTQQRGAASEDEQ